ncbi:MAG: ATP-binding protein [Chloroflexi bacterium]|nr:ATP-binding protein [Chloroflexota bacterium]
MLRQRLSFRARLLAANLAVVAVGSVVVFAGVGFLAPDLFDVAMGRAMGAGGMGMDAMMGDLVRASFQDAVGTALLVATGIAVIAALGLSALLSAQVARPLGRLAHAAHRIAVGHYDERVEVGTGDEIGRLATSFNQMAASLEANERRRTELVGDVAHELRTPLATLEGYLEGLEDGVVEPGPRTWMLLRAETGRLTRLVDDLQQLWRAETGQLPLAPVTLEPRTFLEAVAQRFAARARERSIGLRVDVASPLPAVRADPERLGQVLDNYVANSLRYGPRDAEVLLRAIPETSGVTFSVVDRGPGLTAEQRERVFERFYRVDASRSRALGGSGIGLAVARALAQAMGGRVWAESAGPGTGATFSVWLPAA